MSKKTKWILGAIGVVLVAIVIFQNRATVDTKVLFFTLSMPRAVLLATTFLIGTAVGLLVAGRVRRS